jgi:hypothetical protein
LAPSRIPSLGVFVAVNFAFAASKMEPQPPSFAGRMITAAMITR